MKYVLLIHSNPQPWGHPTSDYLDVYRSLPAEQREKMNADFEALLGELSSSGELLGGQPLADPSSARLFTVTDGRSTVTDGPYSESTEHFAGYFLIDVNDQQRAEEIARRFSGPGEIVELRAVMTGDEAPPAG